LYQAKDWANIILRQEEKIMQLSIGDKVMYPRHGIGQVTGVKHQELVEGFEHYYVIEIFGQRMIAHVPMRKADELGVRPVMPRAKLARVLDTLRGVPRRLSEDHKERQERIREKLKTARPIPVAEVVRDLTWRGRLTRLGRTDSELLARGRELLAGETALVTDAEVADAERMIDAALAVAMAKEPEREATAPVQDTILEEAR
jgi:CarD family transcriptional regulator